VSPASPNSRNAYGAHVLSGRSCSQRERILALLRSSARPLSRKEIAHYFGFPAQDGGPEIPLASVCGRVNSMLPCPDKGKAGLLRVKYVEADPVTHQRVDYLEAVPAAEIGPQLTMRLDLTAVGAFRPVGPSVSVGMEAA